MVLRGGAGDLGVRVPDRDPGEIPGRDLGAVERGREEDGEADEWGRGVRGGGVTGALAWARASGLGRWRAMRGERGEWPCGARGRWASAGEGTGHGPDWAVSPGSAWEWAERDEREGWADLG